MDKYNIFIPYETIVEFYAKPPTERICCLLHGWHGFGYYKGVYLMKPEFKGNYDPSQAYEALVVVLYTTNNKYYVSNAAIEAGQEPTKNNNWVAIENSHATADVTALTKRVNKIEIATIPAVETKADNAKTAADQAAADAQTATNDAASALQKANSVETNVTTNTQNIDNLDNVVSAILKGYGVTS
jgi:hypothetical protein